MRRFILGVALVLAAGQAGAVDLQPGDLIASGNPVGIYDSFDYPVSVVRINPATGHAEVISGCSDAECDMVVGAGPVPSGIDGVAFADSGEILADVDFRGLEAIDGLVFEVAEGHPLAPCSSDEYFCEGVLSIDPATGDRTLISAAARIVNGEGIGIEVLLGSGLAVAGEDLAIVPPDPGMIPAGIPLPQWFGLLVVGFLFGVFYMKGKYDGRVVA